MWHSRPRLCSDIQVTSMNATPETPEDIGLELAYWDTQESEWVPDWQYATDTGCTAWAACAYAPGTTPGAECNCMRITPIDCARDIADPNLRGRIMDYSRVRMMSDDAGTGEPIPYGAPCGITMLHAENWGITSLEGIQSLRNLREIWLAGNDGLPGPDRLQPLVDLAEQEDAALESVDIGTLEFAEGEIEDLCEDVYVYRDGVFECGPPE